MAGVKSLLRCTRCSWKTSRPSVIVIGWQTRPNGFKPDVMFRRAGERAFKKVSEPGRARLVPAQLFATDKTRRRGRPRTTFAHAPVLVHYALRGAQHHVPIQAKATCVVDASASQPRVGWLVIELTSLMEI